MEKTTIDMIGKGIALAGLLFTAFTFAFNQMSERKEARFDASLALIERYKSEGIRELERGLEARLLFYVTFDSSLRDFSEEEIEAVGKETFFGWDGTVSAPESGIEPYMDEILGISDYYAEAAFCMDARICDIEVVSSYTCPRAHRFNARYGPLLEWYADYSGNEEWTHGFRALENAATGLTLSLWATFASGADITVEPMFDREALQLYIYEGELGYEPFVLRLDGPIEIGDADRIEAAFNAKLGEGFSEESRFGVEDIMEFERYAILSLNSTGGDFREGIEISRRVRELGIATLVEHDAECLSACAVAFMGGFRYVIEDDPVRSRYLEAGGRLGFHRPFLDSVVGFDIADFEGLSSEDINMAMTEEYSIVYDLANELIQEMLASDPTAWSNDLLLRMLVATADETGQSTFVYADQVGHAIDWDITVFGLGPPVVETRTDFAEQMWWLCYNSSFQEMPSLDWRETPAPGEPTDRAQSLTAEREGERVRLFDILIYGLTGEGCEISYEYEGHRIHSGSLPVNFEAAINLHYLHRPKTELASIATPRGQRRMSRQAMSDRFQARRGTCMVMRGKQILDQERCDFLQGRLSENGYALQTYTWPSGNKTILQPNLSGIAINGKPGEAVYHDAFQTCALNKVSGNTFCYGWE